MSFSGSLTSSLVSPLSVIRERKPSSVMSSCRIALEDRSDDSRQEVTQRRFTHKLVLAARDVGDVHVVGGGAEILKLLAGEDVDGDQVNLGVTVLASLGGRHVDDLARAALDHDVTVLAQSRALHGKGRGRAGVGGLEGVLMLLPRKRCQYCGGAAKLQTCEQRDQN